VGKPKKREMRNALIAQRRNREFNICREIRFVRKDVRGSTEIVGR
jgi:hypothetical protein